MAPLVPLVQLVVPLPLVTPTPPVQRRQHLLLHPSPDWFSSLLEHFSTLLLHLVFLLCPKVLYHKYYIIYHTSDVHTSLQKRGISPPQNKGQAELHIFITAHTPPVLGCAFRRNSGRFRRNSNKRHWPERNVTGTDRKRHRNVLSLYRGD